MHISEGVLSGPVLAGGAVLTTVGLAYGLKKMDSYKVPGVAIMSSAFFVASLIHVPIGPSSVHLILNGMTGLLLGWSSFPAIFIALLLQAVLFQFGGITTLGVNTFNMAFPAILSYYIYKKPVITGNTIISWLAGFFCGFTSVLLSALLVAAALISTGSAFTTSAKVAVAAHLPVMVIEGILTGFTVNFIKKIKPEMLE